MPFQVGSACYDTALQAVRAMASEQVGAIVQIGTAQYVVNVNSTTASSITYAYQRVGGGTTITTVSQVTPQPCGLLTSTDGLQLGWLVAGAWLATYAILFLARALRGETTGSYGNT